MGIDQQNDLSYDAMMQADPEYVEGQKVVAEIKPVVDIFLSHEEDRMAKTIAYLRENPNNVSEFALQVQDRYAPTDKYTSTMMLADLIEELLK